MKLWLKISGILFLFIFIPAFGLERRASGEANDPPAAVSQSISTYRDTAKEGWLSATDSDGDVLTYNLSVSPTHGAAVVRPGGSFLYSPNTGYLGTDSFTFEVTDNKGGVAYGTVSIVVWGLGELAPIPPVSPYPNSENDRKAALMVVDEIRARYPTAATPLMFALVAAFWVHNRNFNPPDAKNVTIESIIKANGGSCGQQSIELGEVLSAVGIPHRLVALFGLRAPMLAHTAVEAMIDSHWIFLDPTLGFALARADGSDFSNYTYLSFEEALGAITPPLEVMARDLHVYKRPYTAQEYDLYYSIFAGDPYNATVNDLSDLFSISPPDYAMRESLLILGTTSFLECLSNNLGYILIYKSDNITQTVSTTKVVFDRSTISEAVGRNDFDISDYRWEIVSGKAVYSGVYFVGKALLYFGQYINEAKNEITVKNVIDPDSFVINYYRLCNDTDMKVNIFKLDSLNNAALVSSILIPANQSKGNLEIPLEITPSQTFMIELDTQNCGTRQCALYYDYFKFTGNYEITYSAQNMIFRNGDGTSSVYTFDGTYWNFVSWMGYVGHKVIPWDYDGDGKEEIVFKPPVSGPSDIFRYDGVKWTHVGQIPKVLWDEADEFIPWRYNGREEAMIFRNANGTSSVYTFDGTYWNFVSWMGYVGHKVIPWDYDGDGKEEIVFKPPVSGPSDIFRYDGVKWSYVADVLEVFWPYEFIPWK